MELAFPHPVYIRASVPVLEGLRLQPFVNIDGEVFGKPTLNGFWRLKLNVIAANEQAHLALSAFVTAMSMAGAVCRVPVYAQYRPNDDHGRSLSLVGPAPDWAFDHAGFESEPFGGFRLRAPAVQRDSYIDLDKPALSQLCPGHYVSLGDRLHQVINVSHLDDHGEGIRVSVMPNIRDDYAIGEVVIVDQLRLRCRMERGDQIGSSIDPAKFAALSFVEAF